MFSYRHMSLRAQRRECVIEKGLAHSVGAVPPSMPHAIQYNRNLAFLKIKAQIAGCLWLALAGFTVAVCLHAGRAKFA